MSEVIFNGSKIQKGERVKIPKPILDTLDIGSGRDVTIKFDPDKRQIVIEQEKEER